MINRICVFLNFVWKCTLHRPVLPQCPCPQQSQYTVSPLPLLGHTPPIFSSTLTLGTAGIEPAYPAVWARHCHQYVTTASRSVSGMERNGSAKAEKLSAITIPLLRFTRLTAATKPDERVVELHHKFYLQRYGFEPPTFWVRGCLHSPDEIPNFSTLQ